MISGEFLGSSFVGLSICFGWWRDRKLVFSLGGRWLEFGCCWGGWKGGGSRVLSWLLIGRLDLSSLARQDRFDLMSILNLDINLGLGGLYVL